MAPVQGTRVEADHGCEYWNNVHIIIKNGFDLFRMETVSRLRRVGLLGIQE